MTTTMPTGVDRAPNPAAALHARLASSELRRLLERFVRRRVRAADVDDVVQTVLCDALAAERVPEADSELRRWLVGIARHKIADLHRRHGRERVGPAPELREPAAPVEERALIEWAEQQAPKTNETRQTLDWLAREGEGEKLAAIAEDANLPAAQVRQRVSRLRRMLRERWITELAAVAALLLLVVAVWRLTRQPEAGPEAIVPEPASSLGPREPNPVERARQLRAEAGERCAATEWPRCVELLDEAARLDPAGEASPGVKELRERAAAATREPPDAEPTKGPAPTVPTYAPKQQAPGPVQTTRPTPAPTTIETGPTKPRPNPSEAPFDSGGTTKWSLPSTQGNEAPTPSTTPTTTRTATPPAPTSSGPAPLPPEPPATGWPTKGGSGTKKGYSSSGNESF